MFIPLENLNITKWLQLINILFLTPETNIAGTTLRPRAAIQTTAMIFFALPGVEIYWAFIG